MENNFSSINIVKYSFSIIWTNRNKFFFQFLVSIIYCFIQYNLFESELSKSYPLSYLIFILISPLILINMMVDCNRMVYFGVDQFSKKFPITIGSREIKIYFLMVLSNLLNKLFEFIEETLVLEDISTYLFFILLIIIIIYLSFRFIFIFVLISLDFKEIIDNSWILTRGSTIKIIRTIILGILPSLIILFLINFIGYFLNINSFIIPIFVGFNFLYISILLTLIFLNFKQRSIS